MSEQEAKTCAVLCEKVANLPEKAQEALLNIAEGVYIGMEITSNGKSANE